MVYFKVTEFTERELIVGQTDCGGFALENTTAGLRFGVLCKDMISLGTLISLRLLCREGQTNHGRNLIR